MLASLADGIYYIGAAAVILIGLYMVLVKSNLIKIMLGLSFVDTGINLLLIALGYIKGGTAPIFSPQILAAGGNPASRMVDPLPQALVLTAIVIGLGVTALGLTLAVRVYKHHGTLDADKIRGLKW